MSVGVFLSSSASKRVVIIMNNYTSDENFDYAMHTSLTGLRPFHGVQLILENTVKNFESITSHPNGSFSDTKAEILRNAISDMSIVMTYSLLEGYFFEECNYYLKKTLESPVDAIDELCSFHGISIKNWRERRSMINAVRKLRNKVTHQNGIFPKDIDKKQYKKIFHEDIFEERSYPRMSISLSIRLIEDFEEIAREYSLRVLEKKANDLNSQKKI